ncbi:MAG: hypothetical protein JRF02_01095 [Deltaproteobacteria bacterium]|jgi:hypothetical protein|nr:hypothetical protein [Deltaproteobacteria bacterium]
MKNIIVIFLMVFLLVVEAGNIDTIYECRPNAVFESDSVNAFSRNTIMGSYSGFDFPDQTEWNICEAAIKVKQLRIEKKSDLSQEALTRVQAYIPYRDWDDVIIAYEDWLSIAPAARQPTADKTAAINHYAPWLAARDTLDNYTGLKSIEDFNVVDDPAWP